MSTWPNRGAPGGPCGGQIERKSEQPKQSDHVGLIQANRPPRKPVRFRVVQYVLPVNRPSANGTGIGQIWDNPERHATIAA